MHKPRAFVADALRDQPRLETLGVMGNLLLHGELAFPRSAIMNVHEVPHGLQEVHGIRMPGTGLPGVIGLTGQPYDRIVVTVDKPSDTVTALGQPPVKRSAEHVRRRC